MVIPVCLTGGLVLLMQGEYGRLGHLILTSLASAVCTAGLYGIVWLAIGSNLLVKTEGSAYYGMGHAAVILRAPFAALGRGIEYMLATPYIQSVGREGFLGKYADWLRSLLNEYYPGGVLVLAVLLLLCAAAAAWRIIERLRKKAYWKAGDSFMECYLVCSIVCIPLLQIVQSSLPYYRVFSFAGVVPAFAAAWLLPLEGDKYGHSFRNREAVEISVCRSDRDMRYTVCDAAALRFLQGTVRRTGGGDRRGLCTD